MTYPKPDQKSYLTLSEGPELDRWCACHPDGFLESVQDVALSLRVGAPLDFEIFQALAYAVAGLLGSVVGLAIGRVIAG